jgi:hypothetical protein
VLGLQGVSELAPSCMRVHGSEEVSIAVRTHLLQLFVGVPHLKRSCMLCSAK